MQFASVQQFPLNEFTGLQLDGRREGLREVNIEFGRLAFGSDCLNFQWINN
jgi:hypothetical protein